jgi:hypothetical protein
MSKPWPLDTAVSVTLDGSGNGQARIGPLKAREHWQLYMASVNANTNVKEAQCVLHWGPVISQHTFISQTATGSTGDTCALGNRDMQSGDALIAIWSNGDVGAVATIRVLGTTSLGPPT